MSRIKRYLKGFGDILSDSRNMGRLSTGVAIASLPVALVNPPLYVAIATISLGVFCTSIYLRNRKENYGADIGMLTKAAPGRSTFKGVRLGKLKIKKGKLQFLGLAIEDQKIKIIDKDKVEQFGIDPDDIKLKVKSENGEEYQYIRFRTKHGFKAEAKILVTEEENDQEEFESENQTSKIGELTVQLEVLKQQVEELRSANNILAQGISKQDPLEVGARLNNEISKLRANWELHQAQLRGHDLVLQRMGGFLSPSNAAQMTVPPVLATTGTQTSRPVLGNGTNGSSSSIGTERKKGPRRPVIKRPTG